MNMITSKLLKTSIVLAVATSLLPSPAGIAQDSVGSLQASLQAAICANDWLEAVELTDSLLEIAAPNERAALQASRRELMSRHNSRAIVNVPGCTQENAQSAPVAPSNSSFDWNRGVASVGDSNSPSQRQSAFTSQPITIEFLRVEEAPEWSDFRQQVVGQVTNNLDAPLQSGRMYYDDISRINGSTRTEGSHDAFIENSDLMPGRSTMFTLPYNGDYVRLTLFQAVEGQHPLNQTYPNRR